MVVGGFGLFSISNLCLFGSIPKFLDSYREGNSDPRAYKMKYCTNPCS